MAVCGACGTENRDKARFCRGCARPLVPVPAAPAGEPQSSAPASATSPHDHGPSRRAAAVPGAARARWVVVGLALAVTVLAAGWLGTRDRVTPAAALPAVEAAPGPSAPSEPTVASLNPAGTATAAPAPGLIKAQLPAAEPERPAAERRAKAERDRAARERQRVARSPEPPRPEPVRRQAEPAVPPVAAAVAPVAVQAPQPAATVEQTCAGSGNFLSRDMCRVRACRSPAMAGDPICVRFKEMETANRNRLNQ